MTFPIGLSNGPPPPTIEPGHQVFRPVDVSSGSFTDWFAPYDVHIYRFQL